MPFLDFTAGQILTAAQVDDYLMRQTIMTFDDAAARTSALSAVLAEGMFSFLKDTDALEYYDGSAWVSADSEIPTQSGETGKYLTTDGTDLSWGDVDALPAQAGQDGNYLTTNGTSASWAAIVTDPNPQIFMMMGA
jgi:hypothetical protein|tara:strand:- start:149 stop:556 length:408 start_codon:yes stop_codon:yes gene_type:complete